MVAWNFKGYLLAMASENASGSDFALCVLGDANRLRKCITKTHCEIGRVNQP
jgi:hypothetical protein